MKKIISALTLMALTSGLSAAATETSAKNVILMISDGIGFNGWEAARYSYDGNALPYDNAGFSFYGCTTYSANNPAGYDAAQYWSNFNYQKSGATDSASAATALYTGQKNYDGTIAVDTTPERNPLTTIAEIAAGLGKSTGAISSVEFSHATPGTVDAHNTSRNNYAAIANEMIYNSDLDVIMGAGLNASGDQKYVGGHATLADITDADGANGFTYINSVADFQALANGTMTADKVLGITVGTTLGDSYWANPNDESIVPTLETMTKGAINVLSQNDNGFFLMVEGGAVDWENHGNRWNTMLIEQMDFDNSVAAVMDWVEANSSWDETLLIITADHETGGIWGAKGDYVHTVDPVTGEVTVAYNSGSHTNALVPLWAKGAGSEMFDSLVCYVDGQADAFWSEEFGWQWDGSVIDNTDVFTVMNSAVVPEPATIALLSIGAAAAIRRRRNA